MQVAVHGRRCKTCGRAPIRTAGFDGGSILPCLHLPASFQGMVWLLTAGNRTATCLFLGGAVQCVVVGADQFSLAPAASACITTSSEFRSDHPCHASFSSSCCLRRHSITTLLRISRQAWLLPKLEPGADHNLLYLGILLIHFKPANSRHALHLAR